MGYLFLFAFGIIETNKKKFIEHYNLYNPKQERMDEMIKLIATDVDGTLLQNGAQHVSSSCIHFMQSLQQLGVQFVVASGRQVHSLSQLFHPIQDSLYYIAENGALCVHQNKILSKSSLPKDISLQLFQFLRRFPDTHLLLSCESKAYTESTNRDFLHLMEKEIRSNIQVVPNLDEIKEDFLKIAFYNEKQSRSIYQSALETFSSHLRIMTSAPGWVDFAPLDMHKGIALKRLTQTLGLSPDECIAFGDEENDIGMLSFAGTSYAMNHATPSVKACATFTTDRVETILEHILIKKTQETL